MPWPPSALSGVWAPLMCDRGALGVTPPPLQSDASVPEPVVLVDEPLDAGEPPLLKEDAPGDGVSGS